MFGKCLLIVFSTGEPGEKFTSVPIMLLECVNLSCITLIINWWYALEIIVLCFLPSFGIFNNKMVSVLACSGESGGSYPACGTLTTQLFPTEVSGLV